MSYPVQRCSYTKQRDIAYCAGLIDGEGCIYIGKDFRGREIGYSPLHHLRISVRMCDVRPLKKLHELFGGNCPDTPQKERRPKGHRPIFRWVVADKKAEEVLITILPYLICKQGEAELALQFRKECYQKRYCGVGESGLYSKTPIELIELRDKYRENLSKLKLKEHRYVA